MPEARTMSLALLSVDVTVRHRERSDAFGANVGTELVGGRSAVTLPDI